MKSLKKINAILALFSIFFVMLHTAYSCFAYAAFYYNPFLKWVFALPVMIAVCLHGVLGMLIVYFRGEGTNTRLYAKLNVRTVIERTTAILMIPLIFTHMMTFYMLRAAGEAGQYGLFALVMAAEILFYACVIVHGSATFTRALITLGLIETREQQRKYDRIAYAVGALMFVAILATVIRVYLIMFIK